MTLAAATPRARRRGENAYGEALGAWQWPAFLSGLTLVTCSLPNGLPSPAGLRVQIPLAWCVVASALVLLDLTLTRIGGRKNSLVAQDFGPVMAGVMFLMCALLLQGPSAAAVLTAFSFALPTLGGWIAGRRWGGLWEERSWIDVGLMIFAGITCVSLVVIAAAAGSVSEFHRASVLPWGASNYVAGVLVVCALLLWARHRVVRAAGTLSVIAGVVSILTLSRGAFVALGAGMLVLLWNAGRTSLSRLTLRVFSGAVLFLGVFGMERITAQRSVGGYDPGSNISARFELYELAWHQFFASPIVGTGWLGMRDPAFATLGHSVSFAHNIVLSFLQIGGLLGLIWLVILGKAALRCWRTAPVLRPALAASLAIAMTDPFFEGSVAALVSWLVIGAGCALASADREGSVATTAPLPAAQPSSRARYGHARVSSRRGANRASASTSTTFSKRRERASRGKPIPAKKDPAS